MSKFVVLGLGLAWCLVVVLAYVLAGR